MYRCKALIQALYFLKCLSPTAWLRYEFNSNAILIWIERNSLAVIFRAAIWDAILEASHGVNDLTLDVSRTGDFEGGEEMIRHRNQCVLESQEIRIKMNRGKEGRRRGDVEMRGCGEMEFGTSSSRTTIIQMRIYLNLLEFTWISKFEKKMTYGLTDGQNFL